MSDKKLFLLDGMALSYRAHFAFIKSNLRNTEGIPTGPIYGFAMTILQLIEKEKPTHIAVVWDTHAPTFRHELDENYKANRPPQPDDLKVGIPLIKEMVDCFNIPNIEKDGFEADDIIGTIATEASGEDVDVFMVTPDKDFMQIVSENVKLYKPLNHTKGFDIVDIDGVIDYFGVKPDKVIDVLALIGDTSDNVPGMPGVGKKGAPKLISEYGSIDGLLEAAPEMKQSKLKENLLENAEQLRLSRKMVTIITDVPGVQQWEDLQWNGAKAEAVKNFFHKMGFRTLERRYMEDFSGIAKSGKTTPGGQFSLFDTQSGETETEETGGWDKYDASKAEYQLVNTLDALKQLVKNLEKEKILCFDTETTGVDPITAEILGIALSVAEGEAFYIPVDVADGLKSGEALEIIKPLLESEKSLKVAQNYKYDYIMLKKMGVQINGPVFDTMLAAYLIDSGQALNMDALARKYLNYDPISITTLIGKGKAQKSMKDVSLEEVVPYSSEDADITLRLYHILKDIIKKDELEEVAGEIEFPLTKVLAHMEMRGIHIDMDLLDDFSKDLGTKMLEMEKDIFEKAGCEFNLNSPQQLGDVLFNRLKLPSGKKTKTGQYSTSEQVLSKLAVKYELPKIVLNYRAINKLKSTYVDALPQLINTDTGRIHTNFNQSVAATGRLSSSNPNLQNIPIRTEQGREIRKAFTAAKGYKILSSDYSQVELRIIASIAEDEAMMTAFKNDEDIHARTAKEIFSLDSIEEVTADQRRKAKEVNFGIPYGVSAFGLAQRLGIENGEAKAIIDAYFERFPNIQNYINETIDSARINGYVKTLSGRRRYIPDINSGNHNIRGFAERTAINMPIQGTAADLIKIAMINVENRLLKENFKSRMLLQVHDELVFEIHEDELEVVPNIVKELMESAMQLDVPLKVEMGIADNWLDAH